MAVSRAVGERLVLAMVASRVSVALPSVLLGVVIDHGIGRNLWLVLLVVGAVYGVAGWRYPAAGSRLRSTLLFVSLVDLALSLYEIHGFWSFESQDDSGRFAVDLIIFASWVVPAAVIAMIVSLDFKRAAPPVRSDSDGSFTMPDGTVVALTAEDEPL